MRLNTKIKIYPSHTLRCSKNCRCSRKRGTYYIFVYMYIYGLPSSVYILYIPYIHIIYKLYLGTHNIDMNKLFQVIWKRVAEFICENYRKCYIIYAECSNFYCFSVKWWSLTGPLRKKYIVRFSGIIFINFQTLCRSSLSLFLILHGDMLNEP